MTSFNEQAKDMFAVGPDLYSQFHVGVAGAESMHTAAASYRSTGADLEVYRDQLRAAQNAMRESWQGRSSAAAVNALSPIHDALSRASSHAHSSSQVLDDQGAAFSTAQRKITEVPRVPDEPPWVSAVDVTGEIGRAYEQFHQKAAATEGANQQAYHEYQVASQASQVRQDQARELLNTGPAAGGGGGHPGTGPTPVPGPGRAGPAPAAAGPGAAGLEQQPHHAFAPPALPQSHAVLPRPGGTPGPRPYLPTAGPPTAGPTNAIPAPAPAGDNDPSPSANLGTAGGTVASSAEVPFADPATAGSASSGYSTDSGALNSSAPGSTSGTGSGGPGGSGGYGAGYAGAGGSGAAAGAGSSGATGSGPRSGTSGGGGSRLSRALAGEAVGEAAGRAGVRGSGGGAGEAGMAPGGGGAGGESDKERKSKYGNKKTKRKTNELIGELPDTAPEVIE